jgi:hypothetical protein
VEDFTEEEPCQNMAAVELYVHQTLTPGQPHYQTYNASTTDSGPEVRARMIPNRKMTPLPTHVIAGQRRKGRPPQQGSLPPLSVPLPPLQPPTQGHGSIDFKEEEIRYAMAPNFLQFCKQPGVTMAKVTWKELDKASDAYQVPEDETPEGTFESVLKGEGTSAYWKTVLPYRTHDFIDECFSPLHLRRLSDQNIEKFLQVKPELTTQEIIARVPNWLKDLYEAFLPGEANKLPPRQPWDHKIDIKPGEEPPYQKN